MFMQSFVQIVPPVKEAIGYTETYVYICSNQHEVNTGLQRLLLWGVNIRNLVQLSKIHKNAKMLNIYSFILGQMCLPYIIIFTHKLAMCTWHLVNNISTHDAACVNFVMCKYCFN